MLSKLELRIFNIPVRAIPTPREFLESHSQVMEAVSFTVAVSMVTSIPTLSPSCIMLFVVAQNWHVLSLRKNIFPIYESKPIQHHKNTFSNMHFFHVQQGTQCIFEATSLFYFRCLALCLQSFSSGKLDKVKPPQNSLPPSTILYCLHNSYLFSHQYTSSQC